MFYENISVLKKMSVMFSLIISHFEIISIYTAELVNVE
jgi:hypothetical protein